MEDYKPMYMKLVDIIDKTINNLQQGLKDAEEIYISKENLPNNLTIVDDFFKNKNDED